MWKVSGGTQYSAVVRPRKVRSVNPVDRVDMTGPCRRDQTVSEQWDAIDTTSKTVCRLTFTWRVRPKSQVTGNGRLFFYIYIKEYFVT